MEGLPRGTGVLTVTFAASLVSMPQSLVLMVRMANVQRSEPASSVIKFAVKLVHIVSVLDCRRKKHKDLKRDRTAMFCLCHGIDHTFLKQQ